MQQQANEAGLNWKVDSAGTGGWHAGSQPDHRSITVARQYGVDITGQRARQFTAADFEHFDHIFVMDKRNRMDVLRLARNEQEREKVRLLLDLHTPGQEREVPDPYYDDDGFEAVFKMIHKACASFIQSSRYPENAQKAGTENTSE